MKNHIVMPMQYFHSYELEQRRNVNSEPLKIATIFMQITQSKFKALKFQAYTLHLQA